jgi:hypothetical protein
MLMVGGCCVIGMGKCGFTWIMIRRLLGARLISGFLTWRRLREWNAGFVVLSFLIEWRLNVIDKRFIQFDLTKFQWT